MKSKSSSHGGRRAGAGAPKGPQQATLDKLAARELVRQKVTDALGPLLDAHLANALGMKYLVTRSRSTGKFVRVTEAMARKRRGDDDEEVIEVWEKDPSVHAFTYLLDRALDRPKEQEIEVKVRSGEAEARVARLMATLAREKKK